MNSSLLQSAINPNIKILIVDDLSSVRKILKKLLAGLGITSVEEAEDGAVALRKLNAEKFDLVISDWEMPNLKGIELLEKMRASEQFKMIPFIMISSLNQKDVIVKAAEFGVTDYIAKPFTEDVLRAKIEKAFAKLNEEAN